MFHYLYRLMEEMNNMTNKTEAKYMNTKHAADYLGVSPNTLSRLRIEGGGPVYCKIATRVIYDPADLDKWVNQKKQSFTGENKDK